VTQTKKLIQKGRRIESRRIKRERFREGEKRRDLKRDDHLQLKRSNSEQFKGNTTIRNVQGTSDKCTLPTGRGEGKKNDKLKRAKLRADLPYAGERKTHQDKDSEGRTLSASVVSGGIRKKRVIKKKKKRTTAGVRHQEGSRRLESVARSRSET